MVRSIRYIVYGLPIPKRGMHPRLGYNENQRVTRLRWLVSLDNQHAQQPLFSGSLALTVEFYFPIPPKMAHIITPGSTFLGKPDVYGFVEFLHSIAKNFIYSEEATIASLNCRKLYDKKPRTEFTITEIK